MNIEDNQLLNITQAAALIGFKPQRLNYYFKTQKKPPCTIQGGHKLFNASEILKWKSELIDGRFKQLNGENHG